MTRAPGWFAALSVALAGAAGSAGGTETLARGGWGEPVNGLECRATLRGEETLEIVFRSVAQEPIELFAPAEALWRFLELTQDRVPVRRTDEREDWNINEAPQHFVRIEPGASWSARVDVARGWRPERRLAWGASLTEVTYRNPNKAGYTVGIMGWTGVLMCPVARSSG